MVGVAGAVLAAGAGVRMGRPKAEIEVAGRRLLDHAIAALRDGGCAPVIAVVRDGTDAAPARAVVNPDPGRGMRSSLELAVAAAGDAAALAVVLVDVPGLRAADVGQVVRAWRPGRIAVGSHAGRIGHPIVMSPALWRAAIELAGPDEGARALLAARTELLDEVPVTGNASDLDTPEDLARWRSCGPPGEAGAPG